LVGGELDISDWQRAPDKEFIESVGEHGVHANCPVFGASYEEVFLNKESVWPGESNHITLPLQ
jgi:hypothetical protein